MVQRPGIGYAPITMPATAAPSPTVAALLDWLAQPLEHPLDAAFLARLLHHVQALEGQTLAPRARLHLLELLATRTAQARQALWQRLTTHTPPLPAVLRREVRALRQIQERLHAAFANTEGLSPADAAQARAHAVLLGSQQLMTGFLAATPAAPGEWQQLHADYQAWRDLSHDAAEDDPSAAAARAYRTILLIALAQPAAFTPAELLHLHTLAPTLTADVRLLDAAPPQAGNLYWIDPGADVPAYPIHRRPAVNLPGRRFLACDVAAAAARQAVSRTAASPTPDAHLHQRLLKRLAQRWATPPKRKFPRRRRTYRLQLLASPLTGNSALPSGETASEWMVTNDSPEGYALMHVRGPLIALAVGNLVTLCAPDQQGQATARQEVAVIRWVLSENPEHFEIGVQLLATQMHAVDAWLANDTGDTRPGPWTALLLPASPPLRPSLTVILPAPCRPGPDSLLITMEEDQPLTVREYLTCTIEEETEYITVLGLQPRT